MFLFQTNATVSAPIVDFKPFLSDLTALSKTAKDNYTKSVLKDIENKIAAIKPESIIAQNKADYEKLLAGYHLLVSVHKASENYLANPNAPIEQDKFEASFLLVRKTLLPSLIANLEGNVGIGGKTKFDNSVLQKITSSLTIMSEMWDDTKSILNGAKAWDQLKVLGVTTPVKGNYFMETPSGYYAKSDSWKMGAVYVDYAINYGPGKVTDKKGESEAVKNARQTIYDFFQNTELSISDRYQYYRCLTEMFGKMPGNAYKIISENTGDSPQAKLDAAIDAYNKKYGARFGVIEKPVVTQVVPKEKEVYSDVEQFVQANKEDLKKVFLNSIGVDKLEEIVKANFLVGGTGADKDKCSQQKLTDFVARANNPQNWFYGNILNQLAAVSGTGATIEGKAVLDVNANKKIELFELLLVYTTDTELTAAAEHMLTAKIIANTVPQDRVDFVNLLKKVDPLLATDEQAADRVNVLVKAGLFSEILNDAYDQLDKTQKKLVFEQGGKYYQLTDAGKDAINKIDPSLRSLNPDALGVSGPTIYSEAVKSIERGLDMDLENGGFLTGAGRYRWLGNLLNVAMDPYSNSFWTNQEKKDAKAYFAALKSFSSLTVEQPKFSPGSIEQLALYNALQATSDTALQTALLYKNSNTQTPRTKEEYESLLVKLAADNVTIETQQLLAAITAFDKPTVAPGTVMNEIPENFKTALTEAKQLLDDPKSKALSTNENYPEISEIVSKYLNADGSPIADVEYAKNDETDLETAVDKFKTALAASSENTQKTNIELARELLQDETNKKELFKNLKVSDELKSVVEAKLPTLVEDFLKDQTVISALNNLTTPITIEVLSAAIPAWYNSLGPDKQNKYAALNNAISDADG